MPSHHARDARSFDVVFIHSTIDDYGLSPYEFRVYCHIARRAGRNSKAWPSVGSMAEVCRMSERMVQKAIRRLFKLELLSIVQRKTNHGADTSNFYVLMDPKGEGAHSAGEGAYGSPPGVHSMRGEGAYGSPGGSQNRNATASSDNDLEKDENSEGTPFKDIHKDKEQAPKEGGPFCDDGEGERLSRERLAKAFRECMEAEGFKATSAPKEETFFDGHTYHRA